MNDFRSAIVKGFIACLVLLLVVQAPAVYATSLNDLKDQKNAVEQKKSNLNDSINQKSSEITTIETKQNQLLKQIKKLDDKIVETNGKIDVVIQEINVTQQEIKKLEDEIAILEDKIQKRDELLRERVRAIQVNGSVSYLDVLLGANSFVDFIDRFSAVNTLMDADRQIMREQKEDVEKLEEQKLLLNNKKKNLEEKYAKLDDLKKSLASQKKEKNDLIDELEKEQEKLKDEKQLLEEEYSEALDISKDLQNKIVAEQKRLAEIARQQEAKRNQAMESANLPTVSAGTWTKPTTGRFTSGYGWRNIGFGSEFHYGVDIANSSGTPIVAATDGVVSYAAPLSSYGNVVIITHSVEGQIFTTVYAHLSGFSVSSGSTVAKGQQIGAMGSTGFSTGPHLHFEIHVGPWRGQSVGSVNPLRYVSF